MISFRSSLESVTFYVQQSILARLDVESNHLPLWRHDAPVLRIHQVLRNGLIQPEIEAQVQGADGQHDVHASKMQPDAVARPGAEGPEGQLHVLGRLLPPLGAERLWVREDAGVAMGGVREIADARSCRYVLAADEFAGRNPRQVDGNRTTKAERFIENLVEIGLLFATCQR